tara:strand:+ start:1255 stop:2058 length:804 start_codon:yes stop_codon:yes gene_type:complete
MNNKPKILWLGGNHHRHLYYANVIQEKYPLAGAVIERRESSLPEPPENISEHDKANFNMHFIEREQAEKYYFEVQDYPECSVLEVSTHELNAEATIEFVKSIDPHIVLIFGTGMVRDPLFSSLPKDTINLHLGLSPRYRGSATLFWPFYFLEPNYAGTTFHYISNEPDAGNIIHQVIPDLQKEDGIHDVACKTVIKSSKEVIKLIDKYSQKGTWKSYKQRSTGKNFLTKDFKPEHLRVIYDLYKNKMVKEFLNGNLSCRPPRLIKQF